MSKFQGYKLKQRLIETSVTGRDEEKHLACTGTQSGRLNQRNHSQQSVRRQNRLTNQHIFASPIDLYCYLLVGWLMVISSHRLADWQMRVHEGCYELPESEAAASLADVRTSAALADWVEDDDRTSGRITGTWGYYHTISAMARMANLTGRADDADRYASLALEIRDAFNNAFWNNATGRYTNFGNNSTANATQAAQALALDAGFVPEDRREQVLDALVELTYSYPSSDGQGPHLSGGTIGMGPIVRALSAGGRDDVLWEALQQNDRPSYGYFLAPTVENPQGFTTIGERWTRGSSKNHMILAQIDEWFHAAIAGIQPTALTTISDIWENKLIFEPKVIGDIDSAAGTYLTPWGEARSSWNVSAADVFSLTVTVPANIEAEVRLPAGSNVQTALRNQVLCRLGRGDVTDIPK